MTDTYRQALCAKRMEELRVLLKPKRVEEPQAQRSLDEIKAEIQAEGIAISDELLANIAERDARLKGE